MRHFQHISSIHLWLPVLWVVLDKPQGAWIVETKTEANGKSLVEHWTWAAKKGLMNKNTTNGIRSAVVKVLSVLENWEDADIKALDVEQTLTRFQKLKKKDYMPTVLETYKRRFRLAVASYLSYLRDPGA